MNSVQSSLYTIAIALCAFSTGVLRGKNERTGRPLGYLTVFLTIETLAFVLELLMVHPAMPYKAVWLGLRMSTGLLVAPCLWLTLKESVDGVRPGLGALGRRQWQLIGAGAALTLPLMLSANGGADYYDPRHPVSPWYAHTIHALMLLCIAIFAGQIPYYLWRCRQLLLRLHEDQPAPRSRMWLHLPLTILFTTWVLGLLRTVQCAAHAPAEFTLLVAVIDVSVTVGAIYTMVRRASATEFRPPPVAKPETDGTPAATNKPAALPASPRPTLALPDTPTGGKVFASAPAPAVTCVPDPCIKYRKSKLPGPIRARIKRKVEIALADEGVYRDSLLNPRSLSTGLKEKAHYVSQVINQDFNAGFYELVNRHRIEHAKRLLWSAPEQTALEIALSVGFNSKSTFNSAFRRITGMTPKAYRSLRP